MVRGGPSTETATVDFASESWTVECSSAPPPRGSASVLGRWFLRRGPWVREPLIGPLAGPGPRAMASDGEEEELEGDLFGDFDAFVAAAPADQGVREAQGHPAVARGEDADLGDLFDELGAVGAPLRIQSDNLISTGKRRGSE